MLEQIARVSHSIEIHLLFASIVWLAAWLLTSMQCGSATTKYWIWVATTLNFLLPLSAVPDRLWPSRLSWFTPGSGIGAVESGISIGPAAIAVLCVVWSLGAVAMFVRMCFRIRADHRDTQAGSGRRGPAVDGVLRPRISLPAGIDRLLTTDELHAVFIHELRHAKRGDNRIRLIYEVSLCLLWFHPLVWIIGSRLALYRELSCDEAVAHRALGRHLVSALAKLANPEFPLLLEARASSLLSYRLASLTDDQRQRTYAADTMLALAFAAVLDGTGARPIADQNISIEGGKITSITTAADQPPGDCTTILNLPGYSVMPGIVGMHEHLYYIALPNLGADYSYDAPSLKLQMSFSAPRLYLANGVTTARTAGTYDPYTDLTLKHAIETGVVPGPHFDVTGPYLDRLTGPEDARQTVAYWADRGVTSFKAYQNITREELRAAVNEAHQRGLKVTGHLCSVTYVEAAEIGIDNLEHGFFVNTSLDPDKKPDTCSASRGDYTLEHTIPGSAEANGLIATLIKHHVALTSTLPGTAAAVQRLEAPVDGRPALAPAVFDAMSPSAREAYLYWRNRPRPAQTNIALLLRRDMELERAFVAAGGLLLAGPDPVGIGGNIPGFGDQREIELLVDAGFTPVQAIRIATLNGAIFLGRDDRIGSISVGKNADLVVMKGDPATRIADIENVEIVFKDGVGYDTKKLLDSVKGHYGEY